jgi:hypothetical protein
MVSIEGDHTGPGRSVSLSYGDKVNKSMVLKLKTELNTYVNSTPIRNSCEARLTSATSTGNRIDFSVGKVQTGSSSHLFCPHT